MAIALVTSLGTNGGYGTVNTTELVVSGSDTYIIAFARIGEDTAAVSTVTWNGDAMTEIAAIASGAVDVSYAMYGLVNPDSGTHDLVVTWDTASIENLAIGAVFSGVDQTTPLGVDDGGAEGYSASYAPSLATDSGDWIVAGMSGNAAGITIGNGGTQITSTIVGDGPYSAIAAGYEEASGTPTSFSLDHGASFYAGGAVVLNVAAASSTPFIPNVTYF